MWLWNEWILSLVKRYIRRKRGMLQSLEHPNWVRFGPFEADPVAGELRKDGKIVRLQEQPFQILLALLEHPGKVVTRDELRGRLWPSDTFGEFDQGLNIRDQQTARRASGDSAANRKFVETLPKRGYLFVHAIEGSGKETTSGIYSAS